MHALSDISIDELDTLYQPLSDQISDSTLSSTPAYGVVSYEEGNRYIYLLLFRLEPALFVRIIIVL